MNQNTIEKNLIKESPNLFYRKFKFSNINIKELDF